jgi:hypothetical protein
VPLHKMGALRWRRSSGLVSFLGLLNKTSVTESTQQHVCTDFNAWLYMSSFHPSLLGSNHQPMRINKTTALLRPVAHMLVGKPCALIPRPRPHDCKMGNVRNWIYYTNDTYVIFTGDLTRVLINQII